MPPSSFPSSLFTLLATRLFMVGLHIAPPLCKGHCHLPQWESDWYGLLMLWGCGPCIAPSMSNARATVICSNERVIDMGCWCCEAVALALLPLWAMQGPQSFAPMREWLIWVADAVRLWPLHCSLYEQCRGHSHLLQWESDWYELLMFEAVALALLNEQCKGHSHCHLLQWESDWYELLMLWGCGHCIAEHWAMQGSLSFAPNERVIGMGCWCCEAVKIALHLPLLVLAVCLPCCVLVFALPFALVCLTCPGMGVNAVHVPGAGIAIGFWSLWQQNLKEHELAWHLLFL